MIKHSAYIQLLFAVMLTLVSCEETIELDDRNFWEPPYQFVMVNALAATDMPFAVSLSHAEVIGTYSKFTTTNHFIDPKVTFTVNGGEEQTMDTETSLLPPYYGDYYPQPGDRIDLKVDCFAYDVVTAHTVVPDFPEFEILECHVSESVIDADNDVKMYTADLTLKIHDKPGEKNYYSLMISQSLGIVFESDDPIFVDNQMIGSFENRWPKQFSNYFDDSMFDGKDYVVKLRFRTVDASNVYVALSSLTEDYYLYVKSVMHYEVADFGNDMAESVHIYNGNTSADFGILGAMAVKKEIINL